MFLKLIELPERNAPVKTTPIMGGSKHPGMHIQCQKAQTKPSTGYSKHHSMLVKCEGHKAQSKHTKVLFQNLNNTRDTTDN